MHTKKFYRSNQITVSGLTMKRISIFQFSNFPEIWEQTSRRFKGKAQKIFFHNFQKINKVSLIFKNKSQKIIFHYILKMNIVSLMFKIKVQKIIIHYFHKMNKVLLTFKIKVEKKLFWSRIIPRKQVNHEKNIHFPIISRNLRAGDPEILFKEKFNILYNNH